MTLYTIEPENKKSSYNVELWSHEDGRSFEIEEVYRWGLFTIKVDDDQKEEFLDETSYPIDFEDGYHIDSYGEVVDMNLDDGCSFDILSEDSNVAELAWELWEEGQYEAFENAGFFLDDVTTYTVGPLIVKEVES